MSRCLERALWAVLVAAALAGSGCGRYGPPVRAHERTAASREQNPPPEPIEDPTVDPDDPVVPDQEP